MWQTNHTSAVPKSLGVGVDFLPCSAVKAISSPGVPSPCLWVKVPQSTQWAKGTFFKVSRVKRILTQCQQNVFDPLTIGFNLALHCQIKCN